VRVQLLTVFVLPLVILLGWDVLCFVLSIPLSVLHSIFPRSPGLEYVTGFSVDAAAGGVLYAALFCGSYLYRDGVGLCRVWDAKPDFQLLPVEVWNALRSYVSLRLVHCLVVRYAAEVDLSVTCPRAA